MNEQTQQPPPVIPPADPAPETPKKTKKINPLVVANDQLKAELNAEKASHARTTENLLARNREMGELSKAQQAAEAQGGTTNEALRVIIDKIKKWPQPWPDDGYVAYQGITFGQFRALLESWKG